jgi:cytochrome c556
MRRILTYVVAVAVVGVAAVSAQNATTPADLDAAMKRVAQNNAAAQKAVKSGDFAGAKTAIGQVKAALMDAENFWVINKKDDAIAMSKAAVAAVTATETALSAAAPDQQAVFGALKAQGGTCAACHKQYREQDTSTPPVYSLKAGSI